MSEILANENIFKDVNYHQYLVEYEGDILGESLNASDYYVTIINDRYAIISLQKDLDINLNDPYFKFIIYIKPAELYTLEDVSPIEASKVGFLQLDLPLNLTGKGVDVAVVDTGIDYLNEEFMDNSKITRIECIWDQTIISPEKDELIYVPYGTVYRKDKIDNAIKVNRAGGSPYEIVPSKDQIGHGTGMAGIIGATGKNPALKGICPECNFVVVKLMEDISYRARFDTKMPIFNITSIFSALEFLYRYALNSKNPMVIYLPLGTTMGNHKGTGILEDFIELISASSGIVVVTGVGNERDSGGHTSGIIDGVNGFAAMEIVVSPEQKSLWVDTWISVPDIMSLDIISPSGENTGIIPLVINITNNYTFIFEKTSIKVDYYFPEENTGDEFIRVRFYNLKPGIWTFRLTSNAYLRGIFNSWLPQKGIAVGNTRFSATDSYGTITSPASSNNVISVAAYNQNNNNVLSYSGMGFREKYTDKRKFSDMIDVAAGGVNALTVFPNNKTAIFNGTSVAAAVAAGACAMLFEWGIVQGNDPFMYAQTVKAYIAKGTTRRIGDIYPNPRWGYGILNILKMFQNIE
ncbi:S8 family peptidase [Clostridium vincentii]|uniref:Subtilase family protein n=1 Tax=Clostridium vincentii TaxID=52704 RepID=A0A2T0BH71_9CLOT|nr:S8 family peptidase [Clostridium vincentii]PRR83177.1 Subtilase family protein [Clostridium vincentii]